MAFDKDKVEEILAAETKQVFGVSRNLQEQIFDLEKEVCNGSRSDLAEFLESPFYKLLMAYVREDIGKNVQDLAIGDIAVRTANESGLMYRSSKSLQGGLIALAGVLRYEGILKDITGSELKKENKEKEDGKRS